jgi:hypothetical protein
MSAATMKGSEQPCACPKSGAGNIHVAVQPSPGRKSDERDAGVQQMTATTEHSVDGDDGRTLGAAPRGCG